MEKMLWFQLVVAVLTILAVLIWGEVGIKVFALIAISPFIYYYKWKKPDEREKYNFFKGTQFLVSLISIAILAGVFIFNVKLSDISNLSNVLAFSIGAAFIILNSVVRLYLHYKH
jgi:hypothetical protein